MRKFLTREATYDVRIPLLLGDQSLNLGLSLLSGRCSGASDRRCGSAGERPESCAEEASRACCGLLAVERGSQSLRARALRLGRLLGFGDNAGLAWSGGARGDIGGLSGLDALFVVKRLHSLDGEHCRCGVGGCDVRDAVDRMRQSTIRYMGIGECVSLCKSVWTGRVVCGRVPCGWWNSSR